MHRIWILLLTPSFRYGRWLIALIIFLTTFLYQRQFIAENQLNQSTQLFFSLLFAYIVPVFSFIIERTEHYVECLRSSSALPDEEFQILKDSLSQRSIGWVIATVSFSLLLAFGQLTMIWGSPTLACCAFLVSFEKAESVNSTDAASAIGFSARFMLDIPCFVLDTIFILIGILNFSDRYSNWHNLAILHF